MTVLINARGTLSDTFAIGQHGFAVDGLASVVFPPDNMNLTVRATVGNGLSVNSGGDQGIVTTDTGVLQLSAPVVRINNMRMPLNAGQPGQILTVDGVGNTYWANLSGVGSGTVTSVSGVGSVSGITLSGTVTGDGELTLGGSLVVAGSNFMPQTAGTVLAAPAGTNGLPLFRPLAASDIPVLNQDTTGSAATLANPRNISITGDAWWTVTFDGSADVSSGLHLSNTGVTAGVYTRVEVDAKGRVIAASNPTTLAGYGIVDALSRSGGTLGGALNYAPMPEIPSSIVDLSTVSSNTIRVTGSIPVGTLGTPVSGAVRRLVFSDTTQLLNGPNLRLPGGVDLSVGPDDVVEVVGVGTAWLCSGITRSATLPNGEFTQTGVGSVVRSVTSRLRETFSVRDYGAVGDGVADDTLAFSDAAAASASAVNIVGAEANLPRSPMCRVVVPAGHYRLTSEVDVNNRTVVWELDPAAVITGYQYINGEIYRAGQRQNDRHHGTTDYACTYSIRSNGDLEDGAEVLGITAAAQLATYTDRDTVSLYVDNMAPPALITANTASYTHNTVTVPAPTGAVLRRYRRGMIIDTKHTPKWSGIVDSWNSDGSMLTVTGWYREGGDGTPGTPPGITGCTINGFTKAWAHNANIFLNSDSHATRACGFELGVINNKGVLDFANQQNYIWGYDAVSLGNFDGAVGFISRPGGNSRFFRGFQSDNAVQAGFYVSGTTSHGFISEQTAGVPFQFNKSGSPVFWVDNDGIVATVKGVQCTGTDSSVSIGSRVLSNTPHIDFNSSGVAVDYDARISAIGGTSTAGEGVIKIHAGSVETSGQIKPQQDNTKSLGTSTQRWSTIYAGTGTINTSDATEKQDIRELSDAEIRVASKLKRLVRAYRFKDAVNTKGADARTHIGVIAQDVKVAFESEGLDPFLYSILCYDSWDEQHQIVDASGGNVSVLQEYRPAGGRYGVRYDELLAFIIATL